MKKILLITFSSFMLGNTGMAQIVGSNAFLQGQWLEIGVQGNGSLGASGAPGSYHPHGSTSLAMVYDAGHDGWATGSPAYMGDYVMPGTPFEGWALQANGERVHALQPAGGGYIVSGPGMFSTGIITSYGSSGMRDSVQWTGTTLAGQLSMTMRTVVDTDASWVVMKVRIYNVGVTPVPGVYYYRGCNPNNDDSWPGGSLITDNYVTFQHDTLDRVLVAARGMGPSPSYLALGTIDNRAIALTYVPSAFTIATSLSTLFSHTFPGSYIAGIHDTGDRAMAIVFNLGTIPPGDSATLSYTYLFADSSDLDSAMSTFYPTLAVNSATPAVRPSIYPNPATNELKISGLNDAYNTLTISNTAGQTLIQQPLRSTETTVDIHLLPPGMYQVTLKGPAGTHSDKFIKTDR